MQARYGIPFRRRLLISSLIGTIPLIILGLVLLIQRYMNRRDLILQTNQTIAQVAAESVDGYIRGNIRTLVTLAGSSEVLSGDPGELQGLVNRQAAVQPDWENLSIVNSRGQQIAGKLRPLTSVADRAYFQQAKATLRPAVSMLMISKLGRRPVVAIGVPIIRNDAFAGSVNVTIRVEALLALIDATPRERNLAVTIWGQDHRRIASTLHDARPPGWEVTDPVFDPVFSGRAGHLVARSSYSGVRKLYGYAPTHAAPWVVAVSTPITQVMGPVYRDLGIFIILALTVLALTFWWAIRSANQLGSGVALLAQRAREIGEGRFEQPLVLHTGDELEDLANSLNHMAAELAGVDRLKSELITMVSHELKTPLTSIRASLDLLASGLLKPTQPEYQETMTIAMRQTRVLQEMIDNLIAVSRLRAGEVEMVIEPTSLEYILTNAFELYTPQARQRGLLLISDMPEPLMVQADARQVTLALNNLLDNAIKFTERGRITVRAVREDGKAVVSVTDTGIGFTEETCAHLFQPFFQAEPLLTRRAGGVGLGLWVVRAIIEAHGGEVFARSAGPGQGSTFGFTLPLAEEREPGS